MYDFIFFITSITQIFCAYFYYLNYFFYVNFYKSFILLLFLSASEPYVQLYTLLCHDPQSYLHNIPHDMRDAVLTPYIW